MAEWVGADWVMGQNLGLKKYEAPRRSGPESGVRQGLHLYEALPYVQQHKLHVQPKVACLVYLTYHISLFIM
ncbi:hypothetical protein HanRHA438_Chr06g0282861 [Helianthus annuus]|nr:hypothetical protein HanRHA438_Chr06g0282861 [Helianthus annuus]